MIRFRQVYDLANPVDNQAFAAVRRLFHAAFPDEPEAVERIERALRHRSRLDYDPVLLISEDGRHAVTGLSFVFYFPEISLAYLQYIASEISGK